MGGSESRRGPLHPDPMTVQTYIASCPSGPVYIKLRNAWASSQIEPDDEILLGVGEQPLQEAYAAVDRPDAPPWVFGAPDAWAIVYTPA